MTILKIGIIGLFIGLGVKWFAVESFTVPTESMSPTITKGTKVWALKLPFKPKKGTIIGFEKDGENFVKRIVGIPSDSVVQLRGVYEVYKNQTDNIISFFKIPSKGETLYFTTQTFDFYKNILEKYEKVQAGRLFDKIYIGGKEQNFYTFKHNYYFVQGDNTEESIDSRQFGLISEQYIFGKILF